MEATVNKQDEVMSDFTSIKKGQSAMAHALQGLASNPSLESVDSWTPEGLVETSDVGGASQLEPQSVNERSRSTTVIPSDESDSDAHIKEKAGGRRKSVQVVIEEDKKGEFTITTKDPLFKEIMRVGLQQEAERLGGRSRYKPRDLIFTQQFTTFDRQNTAAAQSPFHGFFTLFWLAMVLLLAKIAAWNYRNKGSVFGDAEILHLMVDRDLFTMLATDVAMCAATSFGFFLQKAIAKDYLTWNGAGWIIQSVWQAIFTCVIIWITFWRDWPWTHTVFIVLHVFVLLMKQHAYAFYNGYLSRVYRRRRLLKEKRHQLDTIKARRTPSSTPPNEDTSTTTGTSPTPSQLTHRGPLGPKYSTNLSSEESEIASIGQALSDGTPLTPDEIETFHSILTTELTILDEELRGKCTTITNMYPANLTLTNFLDWACLPTLVYDLEYPRQAHINWWYVAEKSAATLGVIWTMIIISQAYIYPVVIETVRLKEAGMSLDARWKEFPWVVSDMLFPMLLEHLLSWYVIWECLLNVLAELTRFADRGFYGPWWNSVSFDQYARDWNRPVHNFLLRHVYHSSISFFHLSKMQATFFTFLLSAIVHEVLMFCLFKKIRGYLFLFQLTQLPLAAFSKTKFMKGRDTLGNVFFWFGLFIGPSVITSLYLIV
ncbi:sterol o-acyltransferas-like protein 2 [Plenodomus tracheiphilus IPT5]|uniref:O-acyltransferase n=1 Tax=Plenodomus tracheiphilus IPT5 TaxID=1408161 RepID=A0A6A7BEY9_9PLEO|nr:sterol o-acyltransferas-like protein 2 [Plenodomus tracheiphilus IPT5]